MQITPHSDVGHVWTRRFRKEWTSLNFYKESIWVLDLSLCNFTDLIYAQTACSTPKTNLKSHMTRLNWIQGFLRTCREPWVLVRIVMSVHPNFNTHAQYSLMAANNCLRPVMCLWRTGRCGERFSVQGVFKVVWCLTLVWGRAVRCWSDARRRGPAPECSCSASLSTSGDRPWSPAARTGNRPTPSPSSEPDCWSHSRYGREARSSTAPDREKITLPWTEMLSSNHLLITVPKTVTTNPSEFKSHHRLHMKQRYYS